MLSYTSLISRFGSFLSDTDFEHFLLNTFAALTPFNVAESSYMISEDTGIELGFQNEDAVFDEDESEVFEKGHPIFSHSNLYPKSVILLDEFPFGVSFNDKRLDVQKKAGRPNQTKEGDFLGSPFLIDHYKVDNTVISIDYNTDDLLVKSIQVRDNNLFDHIKI